ncbi:efflux RND transporter periplasmic adaptor subunit [Parasphingorhabdus marina]|nr:efflux RND transporter periplasmic adaptor subunit [Parasphingorhabdus marina]
MVGFRREYLALFGALLLMACAAQKEEEVKQTDPIPAAVSAASPAAETEIITSAGTVRLRRETELGFTTAGQVASVRYDEGDRVRKGAVLAALDTSTVSADLEAARAEQDRAEAQHERMTSLFADGWVTRAQLEQSEAAMRASRASVQASRFASNTSRIIAPGNGILLTRNIDAGQIVAAGQTVMIFGETGKGFLLRVPMTDDVAARVRVGMPAQVTIPAVQESPIDAVVAEKDGRADPRTGTFDVGFLLPASDRLRSGQLGSVDIQVARGANSAISIPSTAIFGIRSGEGLVFAVDKENRVKQRAVVIGSLHDDRIEIASGLKEGDLIVTRGVEDLRDGDLIKPIRAAQ